MCLEDDVRRVVKLHLRSSWWVFTPLHVRVIQVVSTFQASNALGISGEISWVAVVIRA